VALCIALSVGAVNKVMMVNVDGLEVAGRQDRARGELSQSEATCNGPFSWPCISTLCSITDLGLFSAPDFFLDWHRFEEFASFAAFTIAFSSAARLFSSRFHACSASLLLIFGCCGLLFSPTDCFRLAFFTRRARSRREFGAASLLSASNYLHNTKQLHCVQRWIIPHE